ncbi:hypothetical protein CEXT_188901 [Caerostris extrusa]|uniref:Uncharacterized protein n=1 Tax=Caerostris extrusa TaxID=172846 RepID=A0AAV4NRD3_CAEEX|nr:hypothetical protein CEXT_188901 [Caerostris extrusa]
MSLDGRFVMYRKLKMSRDEHSPMVTRQQLRQGIVELFECPSRCRRFSLSPGTRYGQEDSNPFACQLIGQHSFANKAGFSVVAKCRSDLHRVEDASVW